MESAVDFSGNARPIFSDPLVLFQHKLNALMGVFFWERRVPHDGLICGIKICQYEQYRSDRLQASQHFLR